MHFKALLGAALLVGCAKAENPGAADTMAATETPAAAISLASVAGLWDVQTMTETSDSIVTTYILDATDSAAWTFKFPNRDPIPMRATVSGDSVMTESGPFESVLRKGVQVRNAGVFRLQDGKMVGMTVARYETTGPDSVLRLRVVGTKQ